MISFSSDENYNTDLLNWLIKMETKNHTSPDATPYNDGVGNATIGIGFNLRSAIPRNAVLDDVFFNPTGTLSAAAQQQVATIRQNVVNILSQSWSDPTTTGSGGTVNLLNAQVAALHAINNSDSGIAFSHTSFTLTTADADAVFVDLQVKSYESIVDKFISGIPKGTERIALLSLGWNSPALLGAHLKTDIQNGNRPEAWYEIRYDSNSGWEAGTSVSGGLAKRRYAESQEFNLYSPTWTTEAVAAQQQEALSIFQMVTSHAATIVKYDSLYGTQVSKANTDYFGSSPAFVQSTATAIGPTTGTAKTAFSVLVSEYASGNAAITDIIADSATGGGSLKVGGSATVLNSQSSRTIGTLLIGTTGNETFQGGTGSDVIVVGDGADTVICGTGKDVCIGTSAHLSLDKIVGFAGTDAIDITDLAFSSSLSPSVSNGYLTVGSGVKIKLTGSFSSVIASDDGHGGTLISLGQGLSMKTYDAPTGTRLGLTWIDSSGNLVALASGSTTTSAIGGHDATPDRAVVGAAATTATAEFVDYNGTTAPTSLSAAQFSFAPSLTEFSGPGGTYLDSQGISHGFVYFNQTIETFDLPGNYGRVAEVNHSGGAAGSYSDKSGAAHGFLFTNGTFTNLSLPIIPIIPTNVGFTAQITQVDIAGITENGTVIGTYSFSQSDANWYASAFIYQNGTATLIGQPQLTKSQYIPVTVSDNGIVVVSALSGGYFEYQNGNFTAVHSSSGRPFSVNDLGQIALIATDPSSQAHLAYLYSNGSTMQITPQGATNVYITGLNNSGEVSGYYTTHDGQYGFLFNNGTVTMVDPAGSKIVTLSSINDAGEVAGSYLDGNGVEHGFTANPGSTNGVVSVAGALSAFQSGSLSQSVSVEDTATNIQTNLDALQHLAQQGDVNAVVFTDSGIPSLAITGSQYGADAGVLSDFLGSYSLTISSASSTSAAGFVGQHGIVTVGVADTAANIAANLGGLQSLAAAGQLSGITLTDKSTPVLTVTAIQLTQDALAIHDISGAFTLSAPGVSTAVANFVVQQDYAIRGASGVPLEYAGTAPAGGNSVTGWQSASFSSGYNAVVLDGAPSQYTFTVTAGDVLSVTDQTTHQSVTVGGASYLIFDGGAAVSSGAFKDIYFMESGANAQVASLYNAALGRQPDLSGLEYYAANLANGALSLYQTATNFLASPEFQTNFAAAAAPSDGGGANDQAYIAALYQNILHRTPGAAELAYYVSDLQGTLPGVAQQDRAQLLINFAVSDENQHDTSGWLINLGNGAYSSSGTASASEGTGRTQASVNFVGLGEAATGSHAL